MNTKYLNDGRKVVVIGKLNNQEMIVQEIFIDGQGNEIPSGENFTTKSLHDTPVLSWKEKELKDLEKRLERKKAEIGRLKQEYNEKRQKLEMISDVLQASENFIENIKGKDIEIMSQFVTGTIKYLVIKSWEIKPPVEMMDVIGYFDSAYGGKEYEGLKLFSVFGRADGNLEYRMNEYRDGSGGWTTIHPFVNHKDAIEFLKEKAIKRIEENSLSQKSYENCIKMGIVFTDDQIEQYKKELRKNINESLKKNIESKKEIEKKIMVKEDELSKI